MSKYPPDDNDQPTYIKSPQPLSDMGSIAPARQYVQASPRKKHRKRNEKGDFVTIQNFPQSPLPEITPKRKRRRKKTRDGTPVSPMLLSPKVAQRLGNQVEGDPDNSMKAVHGRERKGSKTEPLPMLSGYEFTSNENYESLQNSNGQKKKFKGFGSKTESNPNLDSLKTQNGHEKKLTPFGSKFESNPNVDSLKTQNGYEKKLAPFGSKTKSNPNLDSLKTQNGHEKELETFTSKSSSNENLDSLKTQNGQEKNFQPMLSDLNESHNRNSPLRALKERLRKKNQKKRGGGRRKRSPRAQKRAINNVELAPLQDLSPRFAAKVNVDSLKTQNGQISTKTPGEGVEAKGLTIDFGSNPTLQSLAPGVKSFPKDAIVENYNSEEYIQPPPGMGFKHGKRKRKKKRKRRNKRGTGFTSLASKIDFFNVYKYKSVYKPPKNRITNAPALDVHEVDHDSVEDILSFGVAATPNTRRDNVFMNTLTRANPVKFISTKIFGSSSGREDLSTGTPSDNYSMEYEYEYERVCPLCFYRLLLLIICLALIVLVVFVIQGRIIDFDELFGNNNNETQINDEY